MKFVLEARRPDGKTTALVGGTDDMISPVSDGFGIMVGQLLRVELESYRKHVTGKDYVDFGFSVHATVMGDEF